MKRLVSLLLAGLCGGDAALLDFVRDLGEGRFARWERALGPEWALRVGLMSSPERAALKAWARSEGWEAREGLLSWRGLPVARYKRSGKRFKFKYSSPDSVAIAEKLLELKPGPDGRAWVLFEAGGKRLTSLEAKIDPSKLPRTQRLKLYEALWLPGDREKLLVGDPASYLDEIGFKPLLGVSLPPEAEALFRERFKDERLSRLRAEALTWAYQVALADSMLSWRIRVEDPKAFEKLVLAGPITLTVKELGARLRKLRGKRGVERELGRFKRTAEARFERLYSELKEALSSAPAERFYLLGVEAYVRGNYRLAERLWRKALELDPKHQPARRALEDLRRRVD